MSETSSKIIISFSMPQFLCNKLGNASAAEARELIYSVNSQQETKAQPRHPFMKHLITLEKHLSLQTFQLVMNSNNG